MMLMINKQVEAVNTAMHPHAESLAKQYINEFAVSLILQAKFLAFQRKDDVVMRNHIDESVDIIIKRRRSSWTRELIIVIGGAFFGAFIQGFITEVSNGRTILVTIYVILGLTGMFMVFLGLRR
jgi:hypothetical protein